MRARELDPLSPGVNATVGYVLFFSPALRPGDSCAEQDHRSGPRSIPTRTSSSVTRLRHGQVAEAVAAYTRAIALGLDTPAAQIYLGAASAHAGDRPRALAVLQQLQSSTAHVSAAELAILLTALGERERAFASLEQAYRARDIQLQYLGVEPGLDPLRSDPRFTDLVRRVGLAR